MCCECTYGCDSSGCKLDCDRSYRSGLLVGVLMVVMSEPSDAAVGSGSTGLRPDSSTRYSSTGYVTSAR